MRRWNFKKIKEKWDVLKASHVAPLAIEEPETIQDLDYTTVSTIWNLKSTSMFPKTHETSIPNVFNPEEGLSLTISYAASTSIANETYYSGDTSGSIIFACDIVFPTTPGDSQLWEFGGSGTGSWVGTRNGGTVLRVRSGDGGVSIAGGSAGDHSTSTCACLDVTDFPKDGQIHTLVCDLNRTAGTVTMIIDGEIKGTATASSGFESGLISGGGTGAYLIGSTNIPGEPTTAWTGGTSGSSTLRVYNDQTINY